MSSGMARKSSHGRVPSHVIGVDDGPFDRDPGPVWVVGAVFAGDRLDGVVSARVRRDGANATDVIARMIGGSRFAPELRAVLLQGIAVGGFNVIDIHRLAELLAMPVVVVARRAPRMEAIREALLRHVRGGRRKWRLIERAGAMERCGSVWIQRAGIAPESAAALLAAHPRDGHIPEPLRAAHLIAGGLVRGQSRGRA